MVWVSFGQRRPRGRRYGYGGYSRRGGGGCLRDLLLVETGCCLAEALGGPQLLLTPAAGRLLLSRSALDRPRAASLVRLYQREVSAERARPCCRMTPSCSAYALDALAAHGTVRGLRLTAARLLRCRPGGPTGDDAVPPVTRAV